MDIQLIGVPLELGCGTVGTSGAARELAPAIAALSVLRGTQNRALPAVTVPVDGSIARRAVDGVYNLPYIARVCRSLCAAVHDAMSAGSFPLVIGGDHSIGLGSIAGAGLSYPPEELAVIWVDAHTDINTEATTPSGNVHGMPLAAALGLCGEELSGVGGPCPKVLPENIFVVAARSIDPPEREIIARHGVNVYEMDEVRARGVEGILDEVTGRVGGRAVHLSFDTDVLEPACFTSTGLNVPDGPTPEQTADIICGIIKKCRVVSMDCVEYNPLMDICGRDKATVLSILESALGALCGGRDHP